MMGCWTEGRKGSRSPMIDLLIEEHWQIYGIEAAQHFVVVGVPDMATRMTI